MVQGKISSATQKGKTWQVKYKDPKTGRMRTASGGQKGVRPKPGTPKAKSFRARHGRVDTLVKYINDLKWKGKAKNGSTIRIPKRFL